MKTSKENFNDYFTWMLRKHLILASTLFLSLPSMARSSSSVRPLKFCGGMGGGMVKGGINIGGNIGGIAYDADDDEVVVVVVVDVDDPEAWKGIEKVLKRY
jgi:hypothetical protein